MSKNTKKQKASKRAYRESISMGLLALPGVIYLIIFNYIPLAGLVIAFKNFKPLKGIWGSDWIGFKNFEFFFTSVDAVRTLRNTLLYNTAWLIIGTFCSVGLALMFYHIVMLMPKFLSAVILSFVAEMFLSYRFGYINQVITAAGGTAVDWYTKVGAWPIILTVVQIWGTVGVSSMIYYAALMSMDEGLLDAAKIDGANKVQQIWHVMIPHLIPIITVQNIVNLGQLFNSGLDLFYQVPKNIGILYPTTDVINTYTFRALQNGNLARSAAVGFFQSVAGFILVIVTNAIIRKVSPENKIF